ncbi:DUF2863 family protein [Herminiimonas fonticola]|uniref:Uncharacterized protein DUF2863 n=1 Tax=Herminiimonas fonticola TaxID=303380 RepID=A0A4R6G1V8_9BURK|nr:DUF2863 family protein [Herminiimonas fonticola]RBA23416.1 Protein of unknown function (DUF2863) [Herminiimonas fonticola]TDN88329.1 uncharacterized protein DUF2863 [Herminiimonas fonticola]
MRRPSKNTNHKLSADSQRLATLAQAIIQAASRLEERNWERQLDTLLRKLLKGNHQDVVDAALDHLFKLESAAYDALMECAEAASESCQIEYDGITYDALLVAMPILAWTRFTIASGPIPADVAATLSTHLQAHVLAPGTKMAMSPNLFSIDQLPRSHAETFAFTQRMAQAALKGSALKQAAQQPETAPFLADTRYLLAVVTAAADEPLFRWQASANLAERDEALSQWNTQAMPNITRLLPGCGIELLLPEAYFVACREGDKQIRPASIRAAVHYLTYTLDVEPNELQAIIGSFGEESAESRVDEYRVSFALAENLDVIYGIVWPLYGQEDDEELQYREIDVPVDPVISADVERKSPIEEILALLEECGVTNVKRHTELFAMEFCDDCGAPLFPDMDAELVHAEMPEDAPTGSTHLH